MFFNNTIMQLFPNIQIQVFTLQDQVLKKKLVNFLLYVDSYLSQRINKKKNLGLQETDQVPGKPKPACLGA